MHVESGLHCRLAMFAKISVSYVSTPRHGSHIQEKECNFGAAAALAVYTNVVQCPSFGLYAR